MQKLTQGQFRAIAQNAIGKLGKNETVKTGEQELRDILTNAKDEHINIMFQLINENNDHLPLGHRAQIVKLYGLMSEILEEQFFPYLPRTITSLAKKLKDSDEHMHEAIANAFGQLSHNLLHKVDTIENSCKQLAAMLKPLFSNFQHSSKVTQVGSALSITKLIQHSPVECLKYILQRLCDRILQQLQSPTCRCTSQILECLLSLILSVEQDYAPYLEQTLEVVNKLINNEEWITRKLCIDILYTLGSILPNAIFPFQGEILSLLNNFRTDRVKPVRDTALEAVHVFKSIQADEAQVQNQKDWNYLLEEEKNSKKSMFKGPINPDFFAQETNPEKIQVFYKEPKVPKQFYQKQYVSPQKPQPKQLNKENQLFNLQNQNSNLQDENNEKLNSSRDQEEEEVQPEDQNENIIEQVNPQQSQMNQRNQNLIPTYQNYMQSPYYQQQQQIQQANAPNYQQNEIQELKEEFWELKNWTKNELNFMNQKITSLDKTVASLNKFLETSMAQLIQQIKEKNDNNDKKSTHK